MCNTPADRDSILLHAFLRNFIHRLLRQFIAQGRMRLPGRAYTPCYEIAL